MTDSPLPTMQGRTETAERLLALHPLWSDRSVATAAGLSGRKTAEIRRRLAGPPAPDAKRLGRDGRARPVDPARGRERAAALLRENPGASLRHIARQAGVSPTTVAAVRDRLAQPPAPPATEARGPGQSPDPSVPPHTPAPPETEARSPDPAELHRRLRRDPSLRFGEPGRTVLRLLEAGAALTHDAEALAAGLPPHCTPAVARLAAAYARSWQQFADELRSAAGAPL
ncbi:hypothetical protein LG634_14895 [Streptomyces bambusae]|uniref:hypothetical protein n=1 Tax=Streptomyces bambusae TaxID=1550616 RepID=UPI001CFC479F|nr:hypothetical protein [Streptomyces bambusae]MCB5166117.1 hypothetical protein [Streptomyces bambusae]